MTWSKHSPSDRELDNIKQLLDARTIHIQLGCNPDADPDSAIDFIAKVETRMREIYGEHAMRAARARLAEAIGTEQDAGRAFQSMYDTALMRIWWEKFGDTFDVRRSTSDGEAGGRLESDHPADADSAAEPHEEGTEQ